MKKINKNELTLNSIKATQFNEFDLYQLADLSYEHGSPWQIHVFKNDLALAYVDYLVLYDEHQLIGFIGYRQIFEEIEVTNIVIHPTFKKQGLGQLLLTSLVEAVENAEMIHLEVRVSNRQGIQLYKKNGFKEIGIRPNYYQNPYEDAKLMQLEINQEKSEINV